MKAIDPSLCDTDLPISRFLFVIIIMAEIAINTAFCISTKAVHYTYICVVRPANFFFTVIMLIIIPLSNLSRIMMFELLYYQVIALRKRLQQVLSELLLLSNSYIIRENLRHCMLKYKNILDIADGISTSVKIMVSIFSINKSKLWSVTSKLYNILNN